MKRLIRQALVLGALVSVPAAALARHATDASPLTDKKDDKAKNKDKSKAKTKTPTPAPSSSHSSSHSPSH
jgi:hypothetical protein